MAGLGPATHDFIRKPAVASSKNRHINRQIIRHKVRNPRLYDIYFPRFLMPTEPADNLV
jgi:hypothetical protein